MAEMLAVVASGMSVISLALQVADNIEKIRGFCELLKTAPEEVRLVIEEVEILSLILEDIDRSVQQELLLSPVIKVAVMKSLRLCRASGEALGTLAKEMEESIVLGKKRGALKVALKKEKMDMFRRKLENAKATFLLAHHCYTQAMQQKKWESHEGDMIEMKTALSALQNRSGKNAMCVKSMCEASEESESDTEDVMCSQEASRSPSRTPSSSSHVGRLSRENRIHKQSGSNILFGMVKLVKKNWKNGATTSIYLSFPRWLFARRFEILLHNSYNGWNQSFRSYKVKDYGSDVFCYSTAGDIQGLQRLFKSGEATPFEVDPRGWTPLHYAAKSARAATCRFLLENGADANVPTSWKGRYYTDRLERYNEIFLRSMLRYLPTSGVSSPSHSTPLHLLAGSVNEDIDIFRGARKRNNEPLEIMGTGGAIDPAIQATVEALVSLGQSDPFLQDCYGNTVYHFLDASTTPWYWLRQQEKIQLANMTPDEIRDIILARCLDLRGHDLKDLCGILPEGGKLRQLVDSGPEESYGQCFLLNICWSLIMRAFFDRNFTTNWKFFSEVKRYSIITELVAAGVDIHDKVSGDGTPMTILAILLAMSKELNSLSINQSAPIFNDDFRSCKTPRSGNGVPLYAMLAWLRPLAAAGVDLLAYGEEEREQHRRGESTWIFEAKMDFDGNDPYHLTYEILDIRPAALPDDFRIVWEDLYVSSAFAESFWRLVERDAEFAPDMPGSWPD